MCKFGFHGVDFLGCCRAPDELSARPRVLHAKGPVSSVRESQAFGREEENIVRFNESNAASRDASIRAVAFTSALSPTLEAMGYVSIAIVAGVGGWLLLQGHNLCTRLGSPFWA